MPFWKSLLIDFSFVLLYYLFYHFLGFEITVVLVLAQIMSHLVQKEYPKKPNTKKMVYTPQKRKLRI